MSSFYSSLHWVLCYWAHFTVPKFVCVCVFCVCLVILHMCIVTGGVDLVGLKPNP